MRGKDIIGTAFLRGTLYQLEVTVRKPIVNVCQKNEGMLWHRRLGHISQERMNIFSKNNLIPSNIQKMKIDFCDVCIEGKQVREPFNRTRNRAKRVLERIHSDVCGPLSPMAWEGFRYFVSFIDDLSHYAMIFLKKKKCEVFQQLKEYEALSTSMFQTSIS